MKYVNSAGGILHGSLYVDQSHPDYQRYVDGEFGEIEPYVDNTDYLEIAKSSKRDEIRSWFKSVESSPVTDQNGITWNGGFDSALAIDGEVRIAELAGIDVANIYDINNDQHNMSLSDARMVAVAVASQWKTLFARKQLYMKLVDMAAEIDDVEQIEP